MLSVANRVAAVLVLLVVGLVLLLVVTFAALMIGGRPLGELIVRVNHAVMCPRLDEFEVLWARQLANEPDERKRELLRQAHQTFREWCAGDPVEEWRRPPRPRASPSPSPRPV